MRRRTVVLAIALAMPAFAGCATPKDAPETDFGTRALAVAARGAVGGARFGRDLLEIALVRLPEVLFWKIPHGLLVQLPHEVRLALASKEGRVEGLIADVRANGDAKAAGRAIERLRETTGLPFADGPTWLAWWEEAKEQPASRWVPAFVDAQIRQLDDEDYLVRDGADARLRELSGIDVGYDANGSDEERAEGRAKWAAWRREHYGAE